MRGIKYFQIGESFIAEPTPELKGDELEIAFYEDIDGKFITDTVSADIKNGKSTLNIRRLRDGIHIPYIIKDKKRFSACGFEKCGNRVKLLPLEDSHLRRLFIMQSQAEERIKRLEELTGKLSSKVTHTTIF